MNYITWMKKVKNFEACWKDVRFLYYLCVSVVSPLIKVIVAGVLALLVVLFSGGMMMAGIMSGSGKTGMGMGGTSFVLLLVAWVLALVASWFWYRANALLSEKTGVGLFKTGGLVMFIGALLAVIVIGGLVSLVGEILLIVAWFSVPEGSSQLQS